MAPRNRVKVCRVASGTGIEVSRTTTHHHKGDTMARGNAEDAYNAATKAARLIVQGCIDSVLQGIRDGEVTGEEYLSDRIHEECDNALIYTSDQWLCAYGLPEEEDVVAEGLGAGADSFTELLGRQAFSNLRSAVEAHDFSEAFAVAEDAQLEVTP